MEDFTAILSKSIEKFMVSDDLEFLKFIVTVFLILGCLSMLKDLFRGRRSKSARLLKQIRKQQETEYEKVQSRIERELVLLEDIEPKHKPKPSKPVKQGYFKKNDAYVRLFELIDETMSYGKVCELFGLEGVLQAQSKDRKVYIWYLGELSDIEEKLEQLDKVKGNIKFFFALLFILPLFLYISSGFAILLPKLLLSFALIVGVSIFIDLFTKYYVCLFSLNSRKNEDIYIRVSFVDDLMVSKEQKGLRPRE